LYESIVRVEFQRQLHCSEWGSVNEEVLHSRHICGRLRSGYRESELCADTKRPHIIATEEFSVRVILAMKDTRKLIPLFKIVSSLQESSEACPVFLLAKRILQKCTYPLGC